MKTIIAILVVFFLHLPAFAEELVVIGSGYVGLVAGVCFAEKGFHVTCLDIDQEKIDQLRQGKATIYEPGLSELMTTNIENGNLQFTTDYNVVQDGTIVFLALPTPQNGDGSCNLQYVHAAFKIILPIIKDGVIIVNKSTVPVGTVEEMKKMASGKAIAIVSNPEFLREGKAIGDFLNPDRVVIGSDHSEALDRLEKVYQQVVGDTCPILKMDASSAELSKLAANAMRALRISFMNELAVFSEKKGANIQNVRHVLAYDNQIGSGFLQAGIGYGGSCFPKDIRSLSYQMQKVGCKRDIITAIDEVNNRQKSYLVEKMADYFQNHGGLEGKVIALWGGAFKPETDDIREAPAITIIQQLLDEGAKVHLYDPKAMSLLSRVFSHPDVIWCQDPLSACLDADAIALVTEWPLFLGMNFEEVYAMMKGRAFFDGRNQFHPYEMGRLGFDYYSIGRKPVMHKTLLNISSP